MVAMSRKDESEWKRVWPIVLVFVVIYAATTTAYCVAAP